ncbi:OsmC family protein [Sedimenticola sp.]|uniref:OsmC family protein n=1 Tax=Sedimenticola sp. TaxID=1940285 RepID=UPI0025826587|nr:OsmC family protein [Sedimenticola sp.]MCW8902252.1 OsmC family protein [Sedimenticola sp.]
MNISKVGAAQAPLRKEYKIRPQSARVVDGAKASSPYTDDPFHSIVEPMPGCGATLPVGVHHALGGPHDYPTPGDILCAALAACQDSTIRMVANLLGITLESLEVTVTADIDVRGTMLVDPDVPVEFQAMRCDVQLQVRKGTSPALIQRLTAVAERSCVVLQTLRNPPLIDLGITMQRET